MDFSKVFQKSTRGPAKKSGWELVVRLIPKASHTKIGEIAVGSDAQPYLKVYVTAVPEDNKANKALIALLSKTFHVPKSSLHIVSGVTDRRKVIWFEGDVNPAESSRS